MGTRMREETEYRPKPMVEIGGRPILWHIMKSYAVHGFTDFVVCLGYKGEIIKDYFLNYEAMNNDVTIELGRRESITIHDGHQENGWRVTLADTGLQTMTGARVKRASRHITSDPFLVTAVQTMPGARGRRASRYITSDPFMLTYGDGVSNVDLGQLLEFHRTSKT